MTKQDLTGREVYSNYDALWHLVTMGVIDNDHNPTDGACCQTKGPPTRVAMIDTSVAVDHPNLKEAINSDLALDLFSTRLGAFPYHEPKKRLGDLGFDLSTKVAENLPGVAEILLELTDRLSHGSCPRIKGVLPSVAPEFSSHGTAIAGLIGARPCVHEVTEAHADKTSENISIPLPYRGVDSECEIVPISTNFDTDPEVLIVAFLYAEIIGADVVVLPRIIPDPDRMTPELNQTKIGSISLGALVSPDSQTERNMQLWAELAQLIKNVSMNRPVICAGGNSNEKDGIYPANLADTSNGIISVGAVNAKGYRCGYSALRNPTVLAPSNDSEVFDQTEIRLDEQRANYSPVGVPSVNSNHKFSHYDVISTDVPGTFGYSRSLFHSPEPDEGMREFGSYFCRFGGTSAASALIAGFIALGQSAGQIGVKADGLEKKAWLLSKCVALPNDEPGVLFPAWSGQAEFPDMTAEKK